MSFPRPHGTRSRRAPGWALIFAGAAAIAITSGPASADIYRSIGPDGVISFSNKRSPGARLVARDSGNRKPTPAMPRDTSPDRYTRYDAYIHEAATLYQIPVELVRAVIKVESDFDPRAVSPADARGLMQLIPETASRMFVNDVFDPRENILGGTRYLRVLANLFNGDIELTLAGYNAGEGAVIRHGGIPPYPETIDYVARVLAYYRLYRQVPKPTSG